MGTIVLVTGGSRSGKSSFSQKLVEGLDGARTFVATCPPIDEELRLRIERHREERVGRGWVTCEETLDLAGLLRSLPENHTVLVDCLTLWVNNLLFEAEKVGKALSEDDMACASKAVVEAAQARSRTVVFVTNEVGLGIIPENPLARHYRDLVGRCNQIIAQSADRVVLMVSGVSIDIKNEAGS